MKEHVKFSKEHWRLNSEMIKPEQIVNWKLQEVPIKWLKEHPKNPRQIGKEQFVRLGNLIDKFGLIDKPILNEDFTIIGGHQRIKYFKKQKHKLIECWIADRLLSDEEIDELCIGLNLHQGAWDWEIMANQWEPIDLLKYGFTEDQLMGTCKQAEEILEEQKKNSNKKNKSCPNCGHEF